MNPRATRRHTANAKSAPETGKAFLSALHSKTLGRPPGRFTPARTTGRPGALLVAVPTGHRYGRGQQHPITNPKENCHEHH